MRARSAYGPSPPAPTGRVAFTLIELLVVIAIIAILAALLVPAVSMAMEKGRRTLCLSNIHQVVVASHAYASSRDGQFPLDGRNQGVNGAFGGLRMRGDVFEIMGMSDNVWKCPSNPKFAIDNNRSHGGYAETGVPSRNTSYMYLGNGQGAESTWERDVDRRPVSTDGGPHTYIPQDMVLTADLVSYYRPLDFWHINHPDPDDSRRPEGANQGFADGHGQWVTEFPSQLRPGNGGNADATHGTGSFRHYWWWTKPWLRPTGP
jgi:prepilin-type N-terminal cleavage/methylation domain-containing protein/prepilin-type processing-associated H-X9-DG protein